MQSKLDFPTLGWLAWKVAINLLFLAVRARVLHPLSTLLARARALAPALLQLFNTERGNNWSTRFLDNYLETNPTKKSVLEAKCFLKTSSYTGTIFHPLERCLLPVKLFSQFPPPPPRFESCEQQFIARGNSCSVRLSRDWKWTSHANVWSRHSRVTY